MIILAFILSFIVSYVAVYIVSFFSGEGSDPVTTLKVTCILGVLAIVLNVFQATGFIGMSISTVVCMITFMKFLGFEPITSFFAGGLYSMVNFFLLIAIFSLVV